MAGEELRQSRHQIASCEGLGNRDPEPAGWRILQLEGLGLRRCRILEQPPASRIEGQPRLRRPYPPGRPVEKPDAEPLFQPPHRLADRGFRRLQRRGRGGEAARFHYLGKGFHAREGLHAALFALANDLSSIAVSPPGRDLVTLALVLDRVLEEEQMSESDCNEAGGGIRVTAPGDGERLDVFGGPMIVKAGGDEAAVFLAEHPIPPGYAVPPHRHDLDDEMFYLLEGELTLIGSGGEIRVGPGSFVHLPRGSLHGFRNDTSAVVRFLVICQPGLQAAEMFRHFDRAGRAATRPLPPAEIVEIAAQHGVSIG